MKKFIGRCSAFAASFLPVPLLAAEGDYDISLASDFLTKAQTAITTFWTDNKVAILAILGFIVSFSILWLCVKLWGKVSRKAG